MASSAISSLLEFMTLIGKLKHVKRTGWVRMGVREPESIAGHMYRMAIMSLVMEHQKDVDINRCMRLSLVHDMAESIVGDITPACGVSKEEKHAKEKAAMEEIKGLVGGSSGENLYDMWEEYELQTSPEAKIVKDLDRFDMILQAFEYEKLEAKPNHLQEFFDSTSGTFQNEKVKAWVEELLKQRQDFCEANSKIKDVQGNVSN